MSSGGPYVNLAAACERVIEEKDGVLTLVRVVDRIMVGAIGVDVPSEMPPQTIALTIVVSLRPGDAVGRYMVSVRPEAPSGEQLEAVDLPVTFEGGADRGVNLVLNMQFTAQHEGLYWFDVLLDGSTQLSRIPLRVVYQPQRTGGALPQEHGEDG